MGLEETEIFKRWYSAEKELVKQETLLGDTEAKMALAEAQAVSMRETCKRLEREYIEAIRDSIKRETELKESLPLQGKKPFRFTDLVE